jgi:ankyrin repeat protein
MILQFGGTALMAAAQAGQVAVVEILLEKGANINAATVVCYQY